MGSKRIDGHDIEQIVDSLKYVRSRRTRKPLVIIATVKGKGIDYLSVNQSGTEEHQLKMKMWKNREKTYKGV